MRLFFVLFIITYLNLFSNEIDKEPIKEVSFETLMSYKLPEQVALFAEKHEIPILKKVIPENVKLLDGKKIKIKGFMVPSTYDDDLNVTSFLFAPDRNSCCFGKIPDLNGFIFSSSSECTKNLKDKLIEVTGTLFTEPRYYNEDECVLIYKMNVESVKEIAFKGSVKKAPF